MFNKIYQNDEYLLIITLVTNILFIVDSADSPVEKLSDPKIKELLLGSDGKVKIHVLVNFLDLVTYQLHQHLIYF
jgi:hypothetical protein